MFGELDSIPGRKERGAYRCLSILICFEGKEEGNGREGKMTTPATRILSRIVHDHLPYNYLLLLSSSKCILLLLMQFLLHHIKKEA